MSSFSSPTVQPPFPSLSTSSKSSYQMPSASGRGPSQSSTSDTPSSGAASVPQLASARYIRQFRSLLDHQRQVFDEERALWQMERSELENHISNLETSLRQAKGVAFSQTTFPGEAIAASSSLHTVSTGSGSRYASTGDEFWRGAGGKGDANPTRIFSPTSGQHPPTMRENTPLPRAASSSYDGITFKQSSGAPSTTTNPIRTEHVSLGSLPVPQPDAFYTKHAGHTPLAQGDTSSGIPSGGSTPTEAKKEKPPLEPHTSFAKPPSERSDSYFAGVDAEPVEDKALSGPLGLGDTNDSEAQSFLDKVDSKLEEVVLKEESGSSSPAQGTLGQSSVSDPLADEPPLKFKKSMNFGSQLGEGL